MCRQRGFTLLEIIIALTVAGLAVAVIAPAGVRLYEAMQYRSAVKDVVLALNGARYSAVNSGRALDVEIVPAERTLRVGQKTTLLPDDVGISVQAARELNRSGTGVIRFYPDGGSSGGSVDISRVDSGGVTIDVDWLLGRVSQEAYDR